MKIALDTVTGREFEKILQFANSKESVNPYGPEPKVSIEGVGKSSSCVGGKQAYDITIAIPNGGFSYEEFCEFMKLVYKPRGTR